jgi:hypothetical protein
MGLLAPSDSPRLACAELLKNLPPDVTQLRVLARPALVFYLAQQPRVAIARQPDLERLVASKDTHTWAVLDMALMRQDQIAEAELERALAGWLLVREIPTTLNWPTLLDIDPSAPRDDQVDRSAPIRLLRPRPMEHVR